MSRGSVFMDSMIWVPPEGRGVSQLIRHHETVNHFTEEVSRNWMTRDGRVGFPRACRKVWQCFGSEIEDRRVEGFPIDLRPVDYSGHPEPEMGRKQAGATSHFLAMLRKERHGGGILVAPCGAGKTVMGVGMTAELGRSTLVLVHKEFLMEQFVEAFEGFSGLPPERVGRIQENRADFGPDFPVVVAMIHTILARQETLPPDLFQSFGLVIGDEIHRAGAATWRRAAARQACRLPPTSSPR